MVGGTSIDPRGRFVVMGSGSRGVPAGGGFQGAPENLPKNVGLAEQLFGFSARTVVHRLCS